MDKKSTLTNAWSWWCQGVYRPGTDGIPRDPLLNSNGAIPAMGQFRLHLHIGEPDRNGKGHGHEVGHVEVLQEYSPSTIYGFDQSLWEPSFWAGMESTHAKVHQQTYHFARAPCVQLMKTLRINRPYWSSDPTIYPFTCSDPSALSNLLRSGVPSRNLKKIPGKYGETRRNHQQPLAPNIQHPHKNHVFFIGHQIINQKKRYKFGSIQWGLLLYIPLKHMVSSWYSHSHGPFPPGGTMPVVRCNPRSHRHPTHPAMILLGGVTHSSLGFHGNF